MSWFPTPLLDTYEEEEIVAGYKSTLPVNIQLQKIVKEELKGILEIKWSVFFRRWNKLQHNVLQMQLLILCVEREWTGNDCLQHDNKGW